MTSQILPGVGDDVTLTLYNDQSRTETCIAVTTELARLLAYADAWTREENRRDAATLTFSSTLAAMAAGAHPLCEWFRLHLALRGTSADEVTRKRPFAALDAPSGRLTTTYSFRRALEQALALTGGRTLDVRHLMAAYPVVPDYHQRDFRRLRIDRRAWCLALSEHLSRTAPADERLGWQEYAGLAPEVLLPRFQPDLPAGSDLLGVGREVEAFAMLIASARTAMPLSVGVFGPWGAGKSYFMAALEKRVSAHAGSGPAYLSRVAQVRFNAWHYSEGDVVASLVDQIFRNLRFGEKESGFVLAQRRADVAAQVAAADEQFAALQTAARSAADEEARRRDELTRVSQTHEQTIREKTADLTAAQQAVATAERAVHDALARQAEAMARARATAVGEAGVSVLTDTLRADPEIARLEQAFRTTAREVRWLGANRTTIAWGLVVVAITAGAILLVTQARESAWFVALAGIVTTLAPFAARLLAQARELSAKGEAFSAAVQARADAAAERIKAQDTVLRGHEQALSEARQHAASLSQELAGLAAALLDASNAMADAEQRRRKAEEDLAAASATARDARARLDSLTLGALLADTIQEAGNTDVFQKRLGTLSHARSYFQRLSETMRDAGEKYAEGSGPRPELERVVLYIDDLDRCPEDKVREVLQAVHLLLAFDLFACVVAVDPRWVLWCLRRGDGMVSSNAPVPDEELDVLGGAATPSDYLEKIFQIPLWLRPIQPQRRAALVATLLQYESEIQAASDGESGLSIARDAPRRETGAEMASAEHPGRSRPDVRIDSREVAFLQSRVTPLLDGNARALKRFVNTYGLVKASLSEVESDYFGEREARGQSDPGSNGQYRLCMAQLAILATQRKRARVLARLVDDAKLSSEPPTLREWLRQISSKGDDAQSIAKDLENCLLPELQNLPFSEFVFWFERTRRYSFYV